MTTQLGTLFGPAPVGPPPRRWRVAVLLAVALTMALTGCAVRQSGSPVAVPGAGSAATTTSTTAPQTSQPQASEVQVSVYFVQHEKIVTTRRTVPGPAVAAEAVRALIAGPSATERQAGFSSAIPAGTALRGVSVRDGTAAVDLNGIYQSGGGTASMTARLAQVVYTLTQFPTIQRVLFQLDGQPVTVFSGEGLILDHPSVRADFEDIAPAVLVESPTIGQAVVSPLRVYGSANVFEAVFFLRLVDPAGRILTDQRVQATSGTGTRGTFDVTLRFTVPANGTGSLVAWYDSPNDGREVIVTRTPVELRR